MVRNIVPSLLQLQHKFDKKRKNIPDITVQQPLAASYDKLLKNASPLEVH
jgi:hypothetical protein